MKKYFCWNSTQWNDEVYYVEANDEQEAKNKLIKKYNLAPWCRVEEIKSDCELLVEIDNPEYEG